MRQSLKEQKIEVTAYCGYKVNERPVSFLLAGQRFEVKEILDRWYGQEHDYFKVVVDGGLVHLLKWNRSTDSWFLVKEINKE